MSASAFTDEGTYLPVLKKKKKMIHIDSHETIKTYQRRTNGLLNIHRQRHSGNIDLEMIDVPIESKHSKVDIKWN